MKLILASASPRRKELLAKIGLPFDIIPAKGEETITKESPAEVVMELSRQKAQEIAEQQAEECIIIGADTIVAKGETIMGKPKDEEDAYRMLAGISDDCHQVYTGVAFCRDGKVLSSFVQCTEVDFYPLTERQIQRYLATKEPFDKAGAYGIQGKGGLFVRGIRGDYFNVVGFPLARAAQELEQLFGADKGPD